MISINSGSTPTTLVIIRIDGVSYHVVTYILKYLIDAHTKDFQGDLLIHRALLTLSGVNSNNNENQTKGLCL